MKNRQCYSGIGGQAVLEGVMMKNREHYAVAVRRQDGTIAVEKGEYRGILGDSGIMKIPFIRGVFAFLDSMILGMRTLNISASYYEEEESGEEKEKAADAAEEKKDSGIATALTMVLAFALAIGLFMLLPYYISQFFRRFITSPAAIAVIEGVTRLVIFFAYMIGISAMKDIRRLYQYHGAEHKCISCVECGKPLTVENARSCTRFHKRCGTSFILLVVLISIVFFFFIRTENPLMRVAYRILLLPVISGISYEFIRLAGRSNNPLVELISKPGLMTQRITTREPDDEMLEVAIASVNAVFDWKAYQEETFGGA